MGLLFPFHLSPHVFFGLAVELKEGARVARAEADGKGILAKWRTNVLVCPRRPGFHGKQAVALCFSFLKSVPSKNAQLPTLLVDLEDVLH